VSTGKSDEDLMRGIKKGSNEDFHAFYERYFSYVYKIVFSIIKNETDALDICHDLFIEYYQKAHSYHEDRGTVKAWISVRARSRTIDFIRKKKRVVLKDKLLFNHKPEQKTESVEDTVISNMEKQSLLDHFHRLPPLQQQAIYLNYEKALSHKETAKALNRPIGTVKSLIRYGIQNIRKNYAPSNDSKGGDRHDT
jgi:RNA polymerase sigma factor (sigma-70 family)